jgi:beta-lactamase class D
MRNVRRQGADGDSPHAYGVSSSVVLRSLAPWVLLVAGCGASHPAPEATPVVSSLTLPAIDWASHGLDADGCFLVRDVATGHERVSSTVRCATPRRPYSTFKIANALIGLHLGLLEGPDATMVYDKKAYPPKSWWSDDWKHDQPLRTAMEVSAVPLFRRLAKQIGADAMKTNLDAFEYGNRNIAGGQDSFWLDGELRISARQQVDFLTKLVSQKLPVAENVFSALREVLRKDDRGTAQVYGKTGGGPLEDGEVGVAGEGPMLGWMVGWVEHDDGTFVYAMWIEASGYAQLRERRAAAVDGVIADVTNP